MKPRHRFSLGLVPATLLVCGFLFFTSNFVSAAPEWTCQCSNGTCCIFDSDTGEIAECCKELTCEEALQ